MAVERDEILTLGHGPLTRPPEGVDERRDGVNARADGQTTACHRETRDGLVRQCQMMAAAEKAAEREEREKQIKKWKTVMT